MLVLTLMLGVTDWLSGYELQFFIFYFLPIEIAIVVLLFAFPDIVAWLPSLMG